MRVVLVLCVLVGSCGPSASPSRAIGDMAVRQEEAVDELGLAMDDADAVVIGTVIDERSIRSTNAFGDDVIYTELDVMVDERLKGPPDLPSRVTVVMEGGTVEDTDGQPLTMETSDGPPPRAKERAVFFVGPPDGPRRHANAPVLVIDEEQIRNRGLRVDEIRKRVQ